MSHSDYTRNILNIKDKNIFFKENFLEIVNINNIETKVFHGYLTYTPEFCPKCGCKLKGYNFSEIIKMARSKIDRTLNDKF